MRLSPLLALLLALPARAQVIPITGRVSAPVSGASAGAMRTGSATLELSGSSFLAPSLSPSGLGAPAIAPLPAALIVPSAKSPVAAAALTSPGSPSAISASILPAPSKATPFAAALRTATPLSAASKDAGDEKDATKKPGSDPKIGNDEGSEDGRTMFDGAADRPNEPVQAVDASDPNEPSEAELFSAFGDRRPARPFLQRFGIAGALLAVNTIAYAAVPSDPVETGTLAHLSFGSRQFITAIHDLSFLGLLESAGRAFTSMFMHANIGHIFGNMLGLVLFAPWVQAALGWRRTLMLYLAGGAAAAASQALTAPNDFTLGASAAVCALMGASLTFWPKPKKDEVFDVFRAAFQTLAAIVIFGELKSLILEGPISSERVATLAHVVGAAVGLLMGAWYALGRARARAKERAATTS